VLDVRDPEIGALHEHRGIDAVVGMQSGKTWLIFDRVLHTHGLHPAFNLLSVYHCGLVLRVYAHDFAMKLVLLGRFLVGFGGWMGASKQENKGQKQRKYSPRHPSF